MVDNKGQGALEYLLLLFGAVIIAALVLALLSNFPDRPGLFDCDFIPGNLKTITTGGEWYCVEDYEEDVSTWYKLVKYKGEWKPASDFIEIEGGLIPKDEIKDLIK